MRRFAAVAGIFIAAIFAGTLIARAGSEHDTTRDGVVDLRDALDVLSHFGEAPGTPTPVAVIREAHIPLTGAGLTFAQSWRTILVPVNASAYPDGTTFRLWATMHSDFGGQLCVALVDASDGFPAASIPGAVVCASSAAHQGYFSAPFTLPEGQHVLSLDPRPSQGQNGTLGSARLIATAP